MSGKEIMPKRIEYKYGEKLGPSQAVFVKELEVKGYIRRALFICPFCAQQFEANISAVKNGNTQGCGCRRGRHRAKDLSNQRFGKLIALEPTEKRAYEHYVIWKCRCDCGGIRFANSHDLLQGKILSCGCKKESTGENQIRIILDELQIEYLSEYSFDGCKDKDKLRFDFYLPQYNCCIEYNGIQHYKPIEYFGGNTGFIDRVRKDKIKQDFCKQNNIKLIVIPYTDLDVLTKEYLEKCLYGKE